MSNYNVIVKLGNRIVSIEQFDCYSDMLAYIDKMKRETTGLSFWLTKLLGMSKS